MVFPVLATPQCLANAISLVHCTFVFPLIFRQSEREGEKERERTEKRKKRNNDVRETHRSVASHTGVLGLKPATQIHALDQESNLQPFSAQAKALTTENTGSGLCPCLLNLGELVIPLSHKVQKK
uniref:Uncharacterized protein n=1 Tax=Myotis myotis TaxID=51298 RepID=A0A7J7T5V1_MYOMY|nr:hypothetical protein mMyoMyo1_009199 [Myotis myotis]